jgi:hypothetical protein
MVQQRISKNIITIIIVPIEFTTENGSHYSNYFNPIISLQELKNQILFGSGHLSSQQQFTINCFLERTRQNIVVHKTFKITIRE